MRPISLAVSCPASLQRSGPTPPRCRRPDSATRKSSLCRTSRTIDTSFWFCFCWFCCFVFVFFFQKTQNGKRNSYYYYNTIFFLKDCVQTRDQRPHGLCQLCCVRALARGRVRTAIPCTGGHAGGAGVAPLPSLGRNRNGSSW